MSTPQKVPKIHTLCDVDIFLEDASDSSLGKIAAGSNINAVAYLLTNKGCACNLVDRGHKATHNLSHKVTNLVGELLHHVPSVSILLHSSRGDLESDKIVAKGKEKLHFDQFTYVFPTIREDVRYVIIPLDQE